MQDMLSGCSSLISLKFNNFFINVGNNNTVIEIEYPPEDKVTFGKC